MEGLKKKIKESDIQKSIQGFLKKQGYLVIRHQQGLGCRRGIPDLSAVKGGITYYVEVKTPKGKLSSYQEEFRDDLVKHGATYIVARSVQDIVDSGMPLEVEEGKLF